MRPSPLSFNNLKSPMQQEAPVKTAPSAKPKSLTVYSCTINVAQITRHLVPKYGVTAPEIAVLRAIHGNDSLTDIEECLPAKHSVRVSAGVGAAAFKEVPINYHPDAEIARLRGIYGPAVVKHVFGMGFNNSIPFTLADLPAEIPEFNRPDEQEAAA